MRQALYAVTGGGGVGSIIEAAPPAAAPPSPPLSLVLALGCVLGASACSIDSTSADVSIAAAAAACHALVYSFLLRDTLRMHLWVQFKKFKYKR